jgi:hypothetical protein
MEFLIITTITTGQFRTPDFSEVVNVCVNVWAGIIGSHLLGPCILPHRQNHQNFQKFVNNDFVNLLENIPLATLRNMWLQLDGAPPYFALLN